MQVLPNIEQHALPQLGKVEVYDRTGPADALLWLLYVFSSMQQHHTPSLDLVKGLV